MSQDFIEAEAQRHTTITSEAKEALSQGWNSTQDSNALGNLIGATAGTVAGLGKLVPGGSAVSLVLQQQMARW